MKEKVFDKEEYIFEGMVSISAVLNSALGERKITKVLFDKEKVRSKKKQLDYLKAMSAVHGFDIEFVTDDTLSSLTVGTSHGGIVAYCTERQINEISEKDIKDGGFYVYIEGIEDPYNFGYAIRSIYASGADGVILSPRNWMTASATVCRASAGASERIPLYTAGGDLVGAFKNKGYKIACAGIRDSVSAYDADLKKPLLLIVGGEKRGISSNLMQSADTVVRLEYGREFMQSLSAASAAGILAFEVLRQNR